MKEIKLPIIISTIITLISGFIRNPLSELKTGNFLNYGYPFPWKFIEKIEPYSKEWNIVVIIINILILTLIIYFILNKVNNNRMNKNKVNKK